MGTAISEQKVCMKMANETTEQSNKKSSKIAMMNQPLIIKILKDQVAPALGCTEPGAVALAVARAKELLNEKIKEVRIVVDKNILKNGLNVGIPGTSERGLEFAAALSLVAGKSEYGLEVLKGATDADVSVAQALVAQKIIKLTLNKDVEGLYICVDIVGEKNSSRVIIEKSHTNIVYEGINGKPLAEDNVEVIDEGAAADKLPDKKQIKFEIKQFTINELVDFADHIPIEDLAFIQDGIDMNRRVAEEGLTGKLGIGIGPHFYRRADDTEGRAKALTAAASEARMAGCSLPVMSSAGSGNHGLVAILPISIIGSERGISKEKIIRAVALSHLVTIFVKVYLGALTPICGCGVAAGVGCAAGLTYLQDGNKEQIGYAINNTIAGVSGMFCDGAKLGCACKLAVASDAAIDAAALALQNITVPSDNGILGDSPEQTIKNLALVSNKGMKETDNVILDVMLHRC